MSHEHNILDNTSHNNWRPNTDIKTLKQRANIIAKIRNFFSKKGVLEIDTPLMAHAPVTDPYLEALKVNPISHPNKTLYLQTSPEYAMKRLLAANSGCIYQICKAFRDEPTGPLHNMEFTMLEWYRVNFDYIQPRTSTVGRRTMTSCHRQSWVRRTDTPLLHSHCRARPHTPQARYGRRRHGCARRRTRWARRLLEPSRRPSCSRIGWSRSTCVGCHPAL